MNRSSRRKFAPPSRVYAIALVLATMGSPSVKQTLPRIIHSDRDYNFVERISGAHHGCA